MKSIYYVGAVVRVYRAAIDYIVENMAEYKAKNSMLILPPVYMNELKKVGTRDYTENFIYGPPGAGDMLYDRSRTDQEYVPVGVVQDTGQGWLQVEVRNPLKKGETIEYMRRDIKTFAFEIMELLDQDGIPLEQANPGNIVKIKHDPGIDPALEINGLLRKKR
jgi:putative protease